MKVLALLTLFPCGLNRRLSHWMDLMFSVEVCVVLLDFSWPVVLRLYTTDRGVLTGDQPIRTSGPESHSRTKRKTRFCFHFQKDFCIFCNLLFVGNKKLSDFVLRISAVGDHELNSVTLGVRLMDVGDL